MRVRIASNRPIIISEMTTSHIKYEPSYQDISYTAQLSSTQATSELLDLIALRYFRGYRGSAQYEHIAPARLVRLCNNGNELERFSTFSKAQESFQLQYQFCIIILHNQTSVSSNNMLNLV